MSTITRKPLLCPRRGPRLPLNFANRLIEAEQQLEKQSDMTAINSLISLYTEAIEYYEYIKDPKSETYQEKLQSLFLHPGVVSAMNIKTKKQDPPPTQPEEKKDDPEPAKEQKTSKTMVRMLSNNKKRNSEVLKKAMNDFKFQDDDLLKRLASRQKTMLTKSTSFLKTRDTSIGRMETKILNEIEHDIKNEEKEEEFYTELEGIMDSLCKNKAQKIAEVKLQYELQMAPLQNGGILMEKVLEKMQNDLDEEIRGIIEESSRKYKADLESLHEKYKKT